MIELPVPGLWLTIPWSFAVIVVGVIYRDCLASCLHPVVGDMSCFFVAFLSVVRLLDVCIGWFCFLGSVSLRFSSFVGLYHVEFRANVS